MNVNMRSILGYCTPSSKQLYIGLTAVFGIGKFRALEICNSLMLDPYIRMNLVSIDTVSRIERHIQETYMIGNDLKKFIRDRIRSMIDMKLYRGRRFVSSLPCRGQRTRKNRKTAKKLNKI